MKLKVQIGQIIGKTDRPAADYTFTFTRISEVDSEQLLYGTRIKKDVETHDVFFGWLDKDGWIDLDPQFILLSMPPTTAPPPAPEKTMHGTKTTCYNCGKECIDLSNRVNSSNAAWCRDCGIACNKRANNTCGTDKEVQALLDTNGVVVVELSTAKKTSPTLKDNRKIKIEVGQVWRRAASDLSLIEIAAIKDGYAATLFIHKWGALTPEGYPTDNWSNDWRLMKTAPTPNPIIGQVYVKDGIWKNKITGINSDGIVSAIQIGYCSGWSDGYVHTALTALEDGKMPRHWVWEVPKPDYTKIKAEVGQTYLRDDGWKAKITSINGVKVGAIQIGNYSDYKDGQTHHHFTDLSDGKMPDRWKLVEEKKPNGNDKVKVKVGQVWRQHGNPATYTISEIRKRQTDNIKTTSEGSEVQTDCGELTPEGYPAHWGDDWYLDQEFDKAKIKIAPGQTWKSRFGIESTITEIVGNFASNKNCKNWGELNPDGTIKNWASDWELVKIAPPSLKVKVGQVWRLKNSSIDYTIAEIKGDQVSVISSDTKKIVDNWGTLVNGCPGPGWDSWYLQQEADPTKIKVAVGQTWAWGTLSSTITEIKGGYACTETRGNWGPLKEDGTPKNWDSSWQLVKIDLPWEEKNMRIKMKVGQVWQLKTHPEEYTITAIKNGRASVLQGTKVFDSYGSITPDGYPGTDWGNIGATGWHMVRKNPLKPKVGQKWRWVHFSEEPSIKGQVFTVESIDKWGIAHMSTTKRVLPSNDGIISAAMSDYWELVEDVVEVVKPKEPMPDPLLLEKLEAIHNGCDNEIFLTYGDMVLEPIVQLGYFVHGSMPHLREQSKRLTSAGLAQMNKLRHERKANELPKVGQVWSVFGQKWKVVEIKDSKKTGWEKDVVFQLDDLDGENVKNTWAWRKGKFDSNLTWVLEKGVEETVAAKEKPKDQKIVAGQVYRCGDTQYRVTRIDWATADGGFAYLDCRKQNEDWMSGSGWYIKNGKFDTINGAPMVLELLIESKTAQETSAKPTFRQMVKGDALNASYRIAAHQLTKGTKRAILSLMEKRGEVSSRVKAMSDLLDTEFGSVVIGMLLGTGLTYTPQLATSIRAQRLAREFRIGSMATAGNAGADLVMEHFIPVIVNALSGLPKEQVRVALPARIGEEEEMAEQENEKEARL